MNNWQISQFFTMRDWRNSWFFFFPWVIEKFRDFFCEWLTKFPIYSHEWLAKFSIFFSQQIDEISEYSMPDRRNSWGFSVTNWNATPLWPFCNTGIFYFGICGLHQPIMTKFLILLHSFDKICNFYAPDQQNTCFLHAQSTKHMTTRPIDEIHVSLQLMDKICNCSVTNRQTL